jgi:hypothetical protein
MIRESFFQYRCYNEHPFIKERAEELFKQYQASRSRKLLDKHKQQAIRKAFKVALAGMYFGDAFDSYGSFVRISLNKNNYYGKTQLSSVFQPELLAVFNWLIDNKILLKVAEHYFDPNTQKETPRGYRLAHDWLGDAKERVQLGNEIKLSTKRNKDAAFIELRDANKRCQRLSANQQKPFSLELLKWYDSELSKHSFKLGNSKLPPFYLSLTRIYSRSSYNLGGRFYSPFQSFRSQTRLHLEIDGEHVCEVDLSSLHPTMLYRMAGKTLDHDPYAVEGYPRSVVKVAMQVLLNTTKPFPPANSLRYYLSKGQRSKRNRDDPVWQGLDITNDYCKGLSEAIAAHNEPISHQFSQGIGLKLQHIDSIFSSCVLHFMKQRSPSTVVIPIHDSYIVKQFELRSLLDALEYAEVMTSRVKGWDVLTPKLKIESITLDDPHCYESILNEYSTRIGKKTTTKEENVTDQLHALVFDLEAEDNELEDAYDLDAGIEQEDT